MSAKFKLTIEVNDNGSVNINSEGVCHHIYLLGVLETIKSDIIGAASTMALGKKDTQDGNTERPASGNQLDSFQIFQE